MTPDKNILTYGTFDIFHMGHLIFLRNLSKLGRLHVGISSDEFNKIKGKEAIIPYAERFEIVKSCRHVFMTFPETCWEQKNSDVKNYNIDCFIIGDDWKGKFDYLKEFCEVIYLPRTKEVSSTIIKNRIIEAHKNKSL